MNPLENWIVRFCVWDFNWKLGFILEKKWVFTSIGNGGEARKWRVHCVFGARVFPFSSFAAWKMPKISSQTKLLNDVASKFFLGCIYFNI